MDAVIRFAVPADAPALVALRTAMFAAMGHDDAGTWQDAAERWFRDRVADGSALIAVAELPSGAVVSSAMAVRESRAPGPTNPGGLAAHVSQVSTLPGHRRRGYALACLRHLLGRLDGEGVGRVDLFATAEGESLYRDLGFRDAPSPALRRP